MSYPFDAKLGIEIITSYEKVYELTHKLLLLWGLSSAHTKKSYPSYGIYFPAEIRIV